MSRVDLERFTGDLQYVPGLSEAFSSLGYDPEAWVRQASGKGCHLISAEVDGLSSSYGEPSDDDLDQHPGRRARVDRRAGHLLPLSRPSCRHGGLGMLSVSPLLEGLGGDSGQVD